jgi:hypothetical protein
MVGERANSAAGRVKPACATEERHANRNCGLHGAGRPLPDGQPVGLSSVRTTLLLHALLESTRQGIRMWPPSGGLFLPGTNVKSKSDRAASVGGLFHLVLAPFHAGWSLLNFGVGPFGGCLSLKIG